MKTIGLIGGMSWESTLLYYRIINSEVSQQLGGLHSAQLLLYSFDFEEIVALQKAGEWSEAARKLTGAGMALKAAGAEALAICTNTMHIVAAAVEEGARLPVIHIADCTARAIKEQGLHTVGLIGTRFTMEQPFYRKRLEDKFGIKVLVPESGNQAVVHQVIYDELCKGIAKPESRARYHAVIRSLKAQGAQAIILGCTEICLLIEGNACEGLPLFDTTMIHAREIAHYAMEAALISEAV